ncbi:MAG: carboxypeptidase-like regulatory domain-containing protein [Planctomycetota bacterium]|nr:carboxypeptidase-like regulatory domain-containing protein [Planctomycetota bacterium]
MLRRTIACVFLVLSSILILCVALFLTRSSQKQEEKEKRRKYAETSKPFKVTNREPLSSDSRQNSPGVEKSDSNNEAEKTSSIEGIVISTGGEPVKDAIVRCRILTTVTDEKGFFVLEEVRPGNVSVIAQHKDFAPSVEDVALKPGERLRGLKIIMHSGMEVIGVVVDEYGKPVEGARASITFHLPPAEGVVYDETDKDGRFRMKKVPPQSPFMDVYVTKRGFVPARTHFRPAECSVVDVGTLTLVRGMSLEGRVVDTKGQPIIDATVYASGSFSSNSTKTDSDGFFSMWGFEDEELNVKVDATGYISASVTTRAGRQNLSVTLQKAAKVEVALSVEDFTNYEVRLVSQAGSMVFERRPSTDKKVIIEPVPPGRWRLLLLKAGKIVTKKEVVISEGEVSEINIP